MALEPDLDGREATLRVVTLKWNANAKAGNPSSAHMHTYTHTYIHPTRTQDAEPPSHDTSSPDLAGHTERLDDNNPSDWAAFGLKLYWSQRRKVLEVDDVAPRTQVNKTCTLPRYSTALRH
eukprot:SAG11_NODE_2991_length_2784_cov_21.557914_2_plen_121_part_00